ncbi:hypothetical protein [Thalassotalea piscium]|uniref:Putative membrane protein n=1 Tax=Thalassotalea piscium TaxID=1230533 RepID=A0A7X0NF18_9GAMM|nr:hypothetical protein [Thalassotalea piscium]MBB6542261.1 putative membrane protein [Thalassotalea piscium]
MKFIITPELFNNLAITLFDFRWRILIWGICSFILSFVLQQQLHSKAPLSLLFITLFLLFLALQSLVISAFIFFFHRLPSNINQNNSLHRFYRIIEWCEALLFALLLPLPLLLFIYALWVI